MPDEAPVMTATRLFVVSMLMAPPWQWMRPVGGPCQRGTDRAPKRAHERATVRSTHPEKTETVNAANDIAEFLVTRRASITPEQAGLPSYGTRRVAGLRREEVASLAGMSVDYYRRLERGQVSGVSELVLEGLAGALQLDEAERAHLFRSGSSRHPGRVPAAAARKDARPLRRAAPP